MKIYYLKFEYYLIIITKDAVVVMRREKMPTYKVDKKQERAYIDKCQERFRVPESHPGFKELERAAKEFLESLLFRIPEVEFF